MPWRIDEHGDRKYISSIYCKEELPSWEELYREFYLKEAFYYIPWNINHRIEDPYWHRARRKLILAWTCNQLNKMIFEDKIDILAFINNKYNPTPEFEKIYFMLTNGSTHLSHPCYPSYILELIKLDTAPKIYTCKLPLTDQYSIFQTSHPRIDIDTLDDYIEIEAIGVTKIGIKVVDMDRFIDILKFILNDIIKYFENGVGWKDNG